MAAFIKKQSVGFYLNALACILGIAGLIAMIVCSTMTTAYALHSFTILTVGLVVGILLIAVAAYAPSRFGNYDYLGTVAVLGAIAAFAAVIGNVINDRILLISGLFSYNSGNMIGWSVFYATVASLVCLLVAMLLLVVGAFLKSVK